MSIVKMIDGKPCMVEECTEPVDDLRAKHPGVYAEESLSQFFSGFEMLSDEQIDELRELDGFDELIESIGDGRLMYNSQTGEFYVFTSE